MVFHKENKALYEGRVSNATEQAKWAQWKRRSTKEQSWGRDEWLKKQEAGDPNCTKNNNKPAPSQAQWINWYSHTSLAPQLGLPRSPSYHQHVCMRDIWCFLSPCWNKMGENCKHQTQITTNDGRNVWVLNSRDKKSACNVYKKIHTRRSENRRENYVWKIYRHFAPKKWKQQPPFGEYRLPAPG